MVLNLESFWSFFTTKCQKCPKFFTKKWPKFWQVLCRCYLKSIDICRYPENIVQLRLRHIYNLHLKNRKIDVALRTVILGFSYYACLIKKNPPHSMIEFTEFNGFLHDISLTYFHLKLLHENNTVNCRCNTLPHYGKWILIKAENIFP